MIKIFLKHVIYEVCVDVIFTEVYYNFVRPMIPIRKQRRTIIRGRGIELMTKYADDDILWEPPAGMERGNLDDAIIAAEEKKRFAREDEAWNKAWGDEFEESMHQAKKNLDKYGK
jgi:hypothetical protein